MATWCPDGESNSGLQLERLLSLPLDDRGKMCDCEMPVGIESGGLDLDHRMNAGNTSQRSWRC